MRQKRKRWTDRKRVDAATLYDMREQINEKLGTMAEEYFQVGDVIQYAHAGAFVDGEICGIASLKQALDVYMDSASEAFRRVRLSDVVAVKRKKK